MSQAEELEVQKLAPTHDFAGKLRQPSLLPHVTDYVEWQKKLRAARAKGEDAPPMPELSPISINLDLTTACNYRCDHCIDWDILNSPIKYQHEELLASLGEMADRGLKSVILIGGGEPTVYRKIEDVVRFLKERDIQVAIVSNGSRNNVVLDLIHHLDERDWVRFSLDSGTDETFQAMHHPARKITLEEICSWVPKMREKNPLPRIGFSFVITWNGAAREDGNTVVENIDEMVMAAKLAKEHRFSYISVKPFLTRSEDGSEVMDPAAAQEEIDRILKKIRAQLAEAKKLEDDDFKVTESINLRVLEQGNWKDFTKQPKVCHMQALRQVLSPLGLYNCPAHRGVEKALIGGQKSYTDGNAVRATMASTSTILDRFDASCECAEVTCLYNKVNWWLEDWIDGRVDGSTITEGDERQDWFL